MYIKTTGLVLRETEYRESSRILTVLTSTEGKITVSAKGAKRRGSRTAASTQFLAYSDMTLFSQRDRYVLTEASSIELFLGLRDDLAAMALGSYFAELMDTLADADIPNPQMLSLGLNCLYALSEGRLPKSMVKSGFELRAMCLAGFEPQLDFCHVCGRRDIAAPVLSMAGGVVHCAECMNGAVTGEMPISPAVLEAMRYIVSCDGRRIFSFKASENVLAQLDKVCEAYLLTQLSRGFGTLDFYKSIV